jgi:hypothetical protein
MKRLHGHYTQITAIVDDEGNVYHYPDYILCAYRNCITEINEAKKVFSSMYQREILVCPDCVAKVEEINKHIVELSKDAGQESSERE